MTTASYLVGRKQYQRPQAVLFANNSGTLEVYNDQAYYVPIGNEFTDFIILSDDNRQQITVSPERLEKRERTINGRMRSYHIADKLKISLSWNMLPSRAFSSLPGFNAETGKTALSRSEQFTTDGGAGGVNLLDWYENNTGSFFVYLAYDKFSNFGSDNAALGNLNKYNQIVEVFFSDFKYDVVKRGGSNHDFWNVSLSLEEV